MLQNGTLGKQDQAGLSGKVIHLELCKRLKFDYVWKWYIHKPESKKIRCIIFSGILI